MAILSESSITAIVQERLLERAFRPAWGFDRSIKLIYTLESRWRQRDSCLGEVPPHFNWPLSKVLVTRQ